MSITRRFPHADPRSVDGRDLYAEQAPLPQESQRRPQTQNAGWKRGLPAGVCDPLSGG
ncbi:hypothetical protein SAMN03159338_1150 [Sphingomonas sp. NFR04]|nr:hypothetical protein SAMN03159338_1150 [Sphingomonas sp. NFR04]